MRKIRAVPKQVLARQNGHTTKLKSRTVSPKPFQGFQSLRCSKKSRENNQINPFFRESPFINARLDNYNYSLDSNRKTLSLPRKVLREQLIDPWRQKIQKQQRQMLKNYGPEGLRVNYIQTQTKPIVNNDYYTERQESPLKSYTNRRTQKKKPQTFIDQYIKKPLQQSVQQQQSAYFFATNSFFGNIDGKISEQTDKILQEQKSSICSSFIRKGAYKQSEFKKENKRKNSSKYGSFFDSTSRSKNNFQYSSSGFQSVKLSKKPSKINLRGATYFKIL